MGAVILLLVWLWAAEFAYVVDSFAPTRMARPCVDSHRHDEVSSYRSNSLKEQSANKEMDVSDLGLTMVDLDAPLPAEFFQGMETTGYESTSRIPSVKDDACMWTEEESRLKAMLAIPGLRGQPAASLAVEFATNTVSVLAFGQTVWSAILRGDVEPGSVKFEAMDGADMVPVIELEVRKKDPTKRWGGFILQIGENSIL